MLLPSCPLMKRPPAQPSYGHGRLGVTGEGTGWPGCTHTAPQLHMIKLRGLRAYLGRPSQRWVVVMCAPSYSVQSLIVYSQVISQCCCQRAWMSHLPELTGPESFALRRSTWHQLGYPTSPQAASRRSRAPSVPCGIATRMLCTGE